jgi:hypothetical protein
MAASVADGRIVSCAYHPTQRRGRVDPARRTAMHSSEAIVPTVKERTSATATIHGSGVLGAGRVVRRGSDGPFGLGWRDRIDDDGCVL